MNTNRAPTYGVAWRHSETFVRVEVHGRPLPNQLIALFKHMEEDRICSDGKALFIDLQRMERSLGLAERRLVVEEVGRTLWHLDRIALVPPALQPEGTLRESLVADNGAWVRVFPCEDDALDWLLGLVFEPALSTQ